MGQLIILLFNNMIHKIYIIHFFNIPLQLFLIQSIEIEKGNIIK